MRFLLRRRLTAWIAICAILLNTFAPAVSQALAAQQGLSWLEICTSKGGRADGRPATPHPGSFEHCPYCVPHGAADAAPPATGFVFASAEAPVRVLAPSSAPPAVAFTWRAAHPRAPPSIS